METFSALLALCAGNSPFTGEFPAQRPVTRTFWCVFFICAWTNVWVNHREAGYLRRHRAQYDVTVMYRARERKSWNWQDSKEAFNYIFSYQPALHMICFIIDITLRDIQLIITH